MLWLEVKVGFDVRSIVGVKFMFTVKVIQELGVKDWYFIWS